MATTTGDAHTCALTTSAGVWCWGDNTYGQLGDGTRQRRLTPVQVSGLAGGVAAISAGSSHTCALMTQGIIACWGANASGQLGDNTTDDRLTPTNIVLTRSDFTALSAGSFHTCAVAAGRTLYCWGSNGSGQLGLDSTDQTSFPLSPMTFSEGVASLSSGGFHTCVVTSDGTVECWGDNTFGQLGDGSRQNRTLSFPVTGINDAASVSAGMFHTCALRKNAHVLCWGGNGSGTIGDGTTFDRLLPVEPSALPVAVVQVSAGSNHTCARLGNSKSYCWGLNSLAQLGKGDYTDVLVPTPTLDLQPAAAQLATGTSHTCAVLTDGTMRCWGSNMNGQLGINTISRRLTASDSTLSTSKTIAVAAGASHTCAITADGKVFCAGDNARGQLGDGTTQLRLAMTPAALTSPATAISTGDAHSCAVTADGRVWCWGANTTGQLGDGTQNDRATPGLASVLGDSVASSVAAGGSHTCAIVNGGLIKCWGANDLGQLGDGTTLDRQGAVQIDLGARVTAIGAGVYHTCALTEYGRVYCWGSNYIGQLGDGTFTQRASPALNLLPEPAIGIAIDGLFGCALMASRSVRCWGANDGGQLGDNTFTEQPTPVAALLPSNDATSIAAGSAHACSIHFDGNIRCWGTNSWGQLGRDNTIFGPFPSPVMGLGDSASLVSGGGLHTCAITASGKLRCWGYNLRGQLGDGTAHGLAIPATVLTGGVSPSAPRINNAIPANASASVSFLPPLSDGGRPILRYDLGCAPGGATASGANSPLAVGGLGNGVQYVCTLAAVNDIGRGQAASVVFVPATVPGPPLAVVATPADRSATVSFSPPASDATAPVLQYAVACGSSIATGDRSPIVASGLTNGVPITCTVVAINRIGRGTPSAPSSAVTPAVPGALSISPTTIDFGPVSLGTSSLARSLVIQNVGAGSATVISVSGTGPFAVQSACGLLGPSQSCAVQVAFTPTAAADVTGTVTIVHNAPGSPATVSLAGRGVASLTPHFYEAILGREPEASGFAFWESELARVAGLGVSSVEVWSAMAFAFFQSAEYMAQQASDVKFVADLYRAILSRTPSAGESSFWTQQLAAGAPRESLLTSFLFSPEFSSIASRFGGATQFPDGDLIVDFYRGALARLPDSGGFLFWRQQLRIAACQGADALVTAANGMAQSFFASPEYVARGRSNAQYVDDLYLAFLRRGGEAGGIGFWTGQLDTGSLTREQVRVQFAASPEFSSRVAAIVAQGCLQ